MVVKGMKTVMKSEEVLLPPNSLVLRTKPKRASSPAARMAAAAHVFPGSGCGSIASDSITQHR